MFNIDHIAISAENLEKTIEFYNRFGFEMYKDYHDDSVDIIMLKLNDIFLEFFIIKIAVPYQNMQPI